MFSTTHLEKSDRWGVGGCWAERERNERREGGQMKKKK